MGPLQTVTAQQYNEQLMCLNDKQLACLNKFFVDLEVDWLFCCSTIPIANATQPIMDLEWELLWCVTYSPTIIIFTHNQLFCSLSCQHPQKVEDISNFFKECIVLKQELFLHGGMPNSTEC